MKQELVRINSIDEIEQPGILYSPNDDTDKIVIHVHGLNGNFYENRFLDVLAKSYTEKNYAFLTFNNRGRDFITELLKGNDFTIIGGSLERFKDCILDIDGVVNWVKEKGYKEIILEGHSYGCNKILYYYNDFLPGGENDFIRYIDGIKGKSEVLNSINISVLVIFGNVDECVLTQPIDVVKEYLNNNLSNCSIQIIDGADHSYTNRYEKLGEVIKNNME